MLEGWHRRLSGTSMQDANQPLDKVVVGLWNETNYYLKIQTNPELLKQRQEELGLDQKRHSQRSTLKDYILTQKKKQTLLPPNDSPANINPTAQNNTKPVSSNPTPTVPNSPGFSNISATLENERTTELLTPPPTVPTTTPTPATIASEPRVEEPQTPPVSPVPTPTDVLSLVSGTCACGKAKVNKQCSLKKCQACCVLSNQPCGVAKHRQAKASRFHGIILQKINDAMVRQTIIWVKYLGGSTPGQV